jgi:hypothetical protein
MARQAGTSGSDRGPTPVKWWQWVLVYPTLFISLAGNAPKLYELYVSYKFNVPLKQAARATERNEAFTNYGDCLPNLQFQSISGAEGASISVGVCQRGALVVLIQPHDPHAPPIYRFVPWRGVANHSSLLVREAAAETASFPLSSEIAQAGPTIVCRKQLDAGRLLIRLRYPDGQCVDQIVNTYTGVVISTVSVGCDPQCG